MEEGHIVGVEVVMQLLWWFGGLCVCVQGEGGAVCFFEGLTPIR